MIGYKAFNYDLTCKGMQYEIGKEYKMDEKPIPCKRGYHFCKTIAYCYIYYGMSNSTRICKIEAIGDIETNDNIKYCTNHIRILEEVTEEYMRKGNTTSSSSGYCNSGNWNSGDRNSGNRNSGNRNSGDWNSGCSNSGIFNTDTEPTIKMFDKPSNWTMGDWLCSKARTILKYCPCSCSMWVSGNDMTEEEKTNHPEYKTIGGYIKTYIATTEEKQKWWDELSEDDKKVVKALPNFDADKFCECVGIRHI